MKKKILVVCLCVILAAIAIVFSTMAYFTDSAYVAADTVTVGNVSVRLRVDEGEGEKETKDLGWQLDGEGNKVLDENKNPIRETIPNKLMPGISIERSLHAVNTGTSKAYVRIHIIVDRRFQNLFEFELADITEDARQTKNTPNDSTGKKYLFKYTTDESQEDVKDAQGNVTETIIYDHHIFTYQLPLAADMTKLLAPEELPTTVSPITGVKLAANLDHKDLTDIDNLHIRYRVDAIQAFGFEDVVDGEGNVTTKAVDVAFKDFEDKYEESLKITTKSTEESSEPSDGNTNP